MQFTLNGQKKTFDGDPKSMLLDYLRNDCGLITMKTGCSGEGACGSCTIIYDDRALLSCTAKMSRVEGHSITTLEGLSPEIRQAFAESFVSHGGLQCGFCTPGIVMRAKAMLGKIPNPTEEDIKKAISINLCRCTGYKKIFKSILHVAARLRGEKSECKGDGSCGGGGCHSDKHDGHAHHPVKKDGVGFSMKKYKAAADVLGERPFVADLKEPGMLFGALRFSDHPRAKVLKIDTMGALKIKGVLKVFTAKDIPGERHIGLIIRDWPLMVDVFEQTRYVGDVIAGVVAESEAIARLAAKAIVVDYEVLTPVSDTQQAMADGAHQLHASGNILSVSQIKDGDADAALAKSAFVSTGTYNTQRIEHAFLEPECCLAKPWTKDGKPGLEVFSQGQGAYEDRKQLAIILGQPPEQINVIQVQNGGAFGGKEDLSVQGHAALFAWLLKKPVRVALTRAESLIMHPKRHPFEMHYSVGCDKAGKLTALKARMICDSGAYASVGMKVIERGVAHAAGAYTVPVVDIHGLAVYTNNIPAGAMRGFGVPQAAFAMESCIDDLCEKGGFDRWQFRWDNAIVEGSKLCSGEIMTQAVGVRTCLEKLKAPFQAARFAGIAAGIKNTGIGCGMPDIGRAKIVVDAADRVTIHHGWTEMGQGAHTMAVQSLVEETGIDSRLISVKVETQHEVACGMTTSSRGTSLIGHAIIDACKKFKQDLAKHSLGELVGRQYPGEWICDWTTKVGVFKPGVETITHYSYSYAAQMVELDDFGKIKIVRAAHDAGRIMNPMLFEGQIEGSIHMGLGYAITEDYPMKDSRPVHTSLNKCNVIRPRFVPPMEVIGVEVNDPDGPFGAKGIGEIGLVPTAAAVANAAYQFDKKRRYTLPLKESKLLLGWDLD